MEPVRVPQRIDEMPHMMIWRADVFGIGFMGIILMVMFEHWIFMVVCLLAAYQYSKIQQGKPEGYLFHLLYSKGIYGWPINMVSMWPTGERAGRSFLSPFIKRLFP